MVQRPDWLPATFSKEVQQKLTAAELDVEQLVELVGMAISEDLAGGEDVTTSATVPANQQSVLELTARASGVVAGALVAVSVMDLVSKGEVQSEVVAPDGSQVSPGEVIVRFKGKTHDLLIGERTALNFLCHLSGIATATNSWVKALTGFRTKVRDTRKTTPGMRKLEKWAVRCGGGVNHRMSLSDAALVKDNHVVAAGGVVPAFAAVRAKYPQLPIEVEVDSLDQLYEVVNAGADLVLLDNFNPAQMRQAVEWVDGRAKLEASGGLSLAVAGDVAATGVDFIAVGAITHSAIALDIGADLFELEAK